MHRAGEPHPYQGPAEHVGEGYRSAFRDWRRMTDSRATHARAVISRDVGRYCFTPELVPAAMHAIVRERGEGAVEHVLARHLFAHLNFTDALENEVVTPVAYMIARGQTGLRFTDAMIADARKIAVDEMHHALLVSDLALEISRLTGYSAPAPRRPEFLDGLDRLRSEAGAEFTPLIMLFFAVVSETLITATLTRVPGDDRVIGAVRLALREHAEDEARHHAYFAEALMRCWSQLTARQRAIVGPLLPRFITAFLAPSTADVVRSLTDAGFGPAEVSRIIEESYAEHAVAALVRGNAEATIRQMRRAGVFDDARTADAFASAAFCEHGGR
jgi:para-aminobenzoate N-oxygenase AurF